MKLARTIDNGIISRARINWLKMLTLPLMEPVASDIEEEKKNHGKSALSVNIGKFLVSVFSTCEKTKVITSINNKGFKIAQEKPSIEPIYLSFRFFITILLIICLCEDMLFILVTRPILSAFDYVCRDGFYYWLSFHNYTMNHEL